VTSVLKITTPHPGCYVLSVGLRAYRTRKYVTRQVHNREDLC